MATLVELTPDGKKLLIAVRRDPRPVHRDRFDPVSAKARRAIAGDLGIDPDTLAQYPVPPSTAPITMSSRNCSRLLMPAPPPA